MEKEELNIISSKINKLVEDFCKIKFKPSRSFICLFGTMLGFVLGVLWIVIRNHFALDTMEQTSGP